MFFHCHSKSSPTSFMGVTLSTSLQMLFYHHSSLFLPSLIFLHVIEITFYFEKMAKQLKEGGLVYFALFYPHSFLSAVIPVHIFSEVSSTILHGSIILFLLGECYRTIIHSSVKGTMPPSFKFKVWNHKAFKDD